MSIPESQKNAVDQLVASVASGRTADFLKDMMETVLRYGKDNASVSDLKLISRSMQEMRYAASVFQKYSKVRKVAVFGSARTRAEDPDSPGAATGSWARPSRARVRRRASA